MHFPNAKLILGIDKTRWLVVYLGIGLLCLNLGWPFLPCSPLLYPGQISQARRDRLGNCAGRETFLLSERLSLVLDMYEEGQINTTQKL